MAPPSVHRNYTTLLRLRLLQLLTVILAALADAAIAQNSLTFESLRELLDTQHIHSIEQLLAALPPELRSHYTLVFASRSLQDASMGSPRVILFGTDAQLIVTFNGDPGQRGYDSVETMEFATDSSRFLFREIRFSGSDAAGPQVSAPNPDRCTACHDDPGRPIWDTAPAWPGVYGERYGAGLSPGESRGMRQFLAIQHSHPRYRHLFNTDGLLNRNTYVADSRTSYNGKAIEPPNAQLSALLATLNVRAILAQLEQRPGFRDHLPALVAAAGDSCGAVADYYPVPMHDTVAEAFRSFTTMSAQANARQQANKNLRHAGRAGARGTIAAPTDLTALRFIAERSLGVSTRHWTLAFERGSYDLSAPPGAVSFEQALFRSLAVHDTELAELSAFRTFDSSDTYCRHLQQMSRATLNEWYDSHSTNLLHPALAVDSTNTDTQPAADAPPNLPALLRTCIGCHSSAVAPPLPFATSTTLRAQLLTGRYPRGSLLEEILFRLSPSAGAQHMPLGLDVDALQQQQLADYFRDLARSR